MSRLFVILILAVSVSVVGLAFVDASMSQYLTALIAVAALCISVVSAFKEDIFPFRPHAVIGELVFAPPTNPPYENIAVLIPIAFVNNGYGSGVIEGLTLKIEPATGAKAYTPVAEVDYQKFISGKRVLHAENMLGAFNSFRLGSRDSLKKNVLFTQELNSPRYPYQDWSPGKHVFSLFIMHSGMNKPVKVGSVEYEISNHLLTSYRNGAGASLSPGRELVV